MRILAMIAVLSMGLLFAGGASAQEGQEGFDGEGSGTATVAFPGEGGEAQITIDWEGLAPEIPDLSGTPYEALSSMPFPHAQHIHAGGQGMCPTPGDDADGNGVIDTPEGLPAYGPVVTSLTQEPGEFQPADTLDIANFPTGGTASYDRTIDLDYDAETDAGTFNPAEQIRTSNAVIVVHGLNPAIMPGESSLEVSPLNDLLPDLELPLAATAPALCGELTETGDGSFTAELRPMNPVASSQVDAVPAGGVAAGGGSMAAAAMPSWIIAFAVIGMTGLAAVGLTAYGRRSRS